MPTDVGIVIGISHAAQSSKGNVMQVSTHTDYRMSSTNAAYAIETIAGGFRVREVGPFGRVMAVLGSMAEVEALFA